MYCLLDQISSSDIVLLDSSWNNNKIINQNPGKYNNYLVNMHHHQNNVPTIIDEPFQFPCTSSSSSSIEKFQNNFLMHHHQNQNDEINLLDNNHDGNDFLMLMNNSSNNSPKDGSDSGIESDYTDGNLSWLLNYKIRELPPVPDSACAENVELNNFPLNHHHQNHLQNGNSETVVVERFNSSSNKGSSIPKIQSNNPQRKPPFTYTELIEHALTEKSELTVSGIYNWISYHFPFYKANDDRWKNSVRHNLSINPHFRKGGKAVHGAGHLWTIAQRDETKSWQMRQRINDFLKMNSQHLNNNNKTVDASSSSSFETDENFDKELQAATESILEIQPHQETADDVHHQLHQQQINKENSEINEDVHVEFINMPDGIVTGLEGFLSPPVSKQQIVDECGLGNDFFITNINPNQLGLNLVETEVNDYDEMSLEYYGIKE